MENQHDKLQDEKQAKLEEQNTVKSVKKGKLKLDNSTIIALVAVLISSISAFISLYEAQMMHEQQMMLSEQKEASVWPYVEARSTSSYTIGLKDSIQHLTQATYIYTIENKGIGPAILSDMKYIFDREEIPNWGLPEAMLDKFGDVVPDIEIIQGGNFNLEDYILATGESVEVVSITIKNNSDTLDFNGFVNTIPYHLEFCYCSVYGACWKSTKNTITKNSTCSLREEIR